MREQELQKALNYAYFYLKFRPRSKKEVADYLTKKAVRFGWTKETVDQAVLSLTEEGLINDKEFIDWYINAKSKSKPKSAYLFSLELSRYGIPKDFVEVFFNSNPIDEEAAVVKALQSRFVRWRSLDKKERFKKAAAFLQRRGFRFDQIKKAIAELEE